MAPPSRLEARLEQAVGLPHDQGRLPCVDEGWQGRGVQDGHGPEGHRASVAAGGHLPCLGWQPRLFNPAGSRWQSPLTRQVNFSAPQLSRNRRSSSSNSRLRASAWMRASRSLLARPSAVSARASAALARLSEASARASA